MAFLVIASALFAESREAQAAPVEGFIQEVYASGLPLVTDIEWAPNGMLYVAQQTGTVRVLDNGTLVGTFVDLTAEVNSAGERGLLGIAVHPQLLSGSPYVYLLYAYDPPETAGQIGNAGPDGEGQRISRLVRVTADAATGFTTAVPSSATVILGAGGSWTTLGDPSAAAGAGDPWACGSSPSINDCLPADAVTHGVGTVRFGPDGMLYVGSGDGADFEAEDRSLRALDLDSLAGKVMRIDPTSGLGLPDNPHWTGDGNDNRSRVWDAGLRNPYRFTFDDAGVLWIGDVGSGSWEELNRGDAGADFGWPCYEGGSGGVLQQNGDFSTTPECAAYYGDNQAVAPVFAYSHASGSAAIIAGEFVDAPAWPVEYQGSLVVADYVRGTIDTVGLAQPSPPVRPLADNVVPVDLTFGPDGHLYFADIAGGAVQRIRYSPDEQPDGMLRAISVPPAPTTISANGVARSQWGLDWVMLQPDAFDVCFSDVPGLTTPPCQTVTVTAETTTVAQGDFVAQGVLTVGAVAAGSGSFLPSVITIDGVAVGEGGVSTQRDAGDHVVCWGVVADWTPPPCETATVTAGATTAVTGALTSSPGTPGPSTPTGMLRVVTTPAVPTTILLDGQPVTQWSTEWIPTPVGTYEVCFTDVPGYVTPSCATVEVTQGATAATTGAFEPLGTLRVTTDPPSNTAISVDGIPRNNWGLFTSTPVGNYEVCAAYVVAPVCSSAQVTAGTETTVTLSPAGGANEPPTADAGADIVVVDDDGNGAESVSLDGSGSSDSDGVIVDFTWREAGVLVATGSTPTALFDVGVHLVELTVTDDAGAQATDLVSITVEPAPASSDVVYLSAGEAGVVSGVSYGDEDIISYDVVADTWSMFFDGSDVGVTEDVSGFALLDDGSLLLSFGVRAQLAGIGRVEPHDIARFVPTSTGSTTAGSFEVYFEGADVDLRDNGEEIDALAVLDNGDLVLSTSGSVEVSGVDGNDEDLIHFAPSSLGGGTDGSWSLWLDGSDVGLTSAAEDLDAATLGADGDVYLSTTGSFAVAGAAGSGGDVFECADPINGPSTSCTFADYWSGAAHGFTGPLDALFVSFG